MPAVSPGLLDFPAEHFKDAQEAARGDVYLCLTFLARLSKRRMPECMDLCWNQDNICSLRHSTNLVARLFPIGADKMKRGCAQ